MAPFSENMSEVKSVFKRVRELQDEINHRHLYPSALTELSMGMSNDYIEAIREGSTMIRVGSALYQP